MSTLLGWRWGALAIRLSTDMTWIDRADVHGPIT